MTLMYLYLYVHLQFTTRIIKRPTSEVCENHSQQPPAPKIQADSGQHHWSPRTSMLSTGIVATRAVMFGPSATAAYPVITV